MINVNFFVPAGGEGRRLRPLTDQLPKPLLPVARDKEGTYERIIDTPVRIARALGRQTVVAGFYESEQIVEYFKDANDVDTVTDSGIIHIGGSIMQHKELLFAGDADYIVMIPGDHSIPQSAVSRMLNGLMASDADVSLLGSWRHDYHETYPVAAVQQKDGVGIIEYDLQSSKPKASIASLGTYAFKSTWLEKRLIEAPVSSSGHSDLTTDIVFGRDQEQPPNLIFEPLRDNEYWQDVGTLRRLYDHILYLHPKRTSGDNVSLDGRESSYATDSVIYVDAPLPKKSISKAFIAKGVTEIYT